MKTTIVMTYYDRFPQLLKTLESLEKYNPKEFNVVIVDDGSDGDIVLPLSPFEITVLKMYNKTWATGDPAWNTGLKYAMLRNPDIIIIQNAECYHVGNILGYAKRVTDETYITFGCYSQGEGGAIGLVINDRCATFDGDSAWYNHPVYRPKGYHFCSAMTAKNLKKLNGFDERFSFGIGYDDDYLLHQIRCLGLKIEITAEPYVIHQWHYHGTPRDNKVELVNKNRHLFEALSQQSNYRATHLLTPDL